MVSVGPSQATGRVQPRHTPTRAMSASRAIRALTISSTWTAPAAWRNVPQVVATGKTRLVTRNVRTLTSDERPQRARPTGPRQRDETDQGDREAGRDEDVDQVVPDAVDPELDEAGRPDRQVAGQGRRISPGEDVEPADRQRIRQRLARQRVAEDRPVADGPRGEDDERDDRGDADDGETPPARAAPPGQADPGQRQPDRLVAGQGGEAEDRAEPDQPRVADRPADRRACAGSGSSAATPRVRRWRTASSSRAARRTGQAAGTRPRSGRCRGPASAPGRARGRVPRRRRRPAARRAPGRATPTRTAGTWAASNVGAEERHRRRPPAASAAAARPRTPAAGTAAAASGSSRSRR